MPPKAIAAGRIIGDDSPRRFGEALAVFHVDGGAFKKAALVIGQSLNLAHLLFLSSPRDRGILGAARA